MEGELSSFKAWYTSCAAIPSRPNLPDSTTTEVLMRNSCVDPPIVGPMAPAHPKCHKEWADVTASCWRRWLLVSALLLGVLYLLITSWAFLGLGAPFLFKKKG